MARQRQRQAIFKDQLFKHGISQETIFVDSFLYSRMESLASRSDEANIHTLMFLAMRDFLNSKSERASFKNYNTFTLNSAIVAANEIAIEQGLTGLFSTVHSEFNAQSTTKRKSEAQQQTEGLDQSGIKQKQHDS